MMTTAVLGAESGYGLAQYIHVLTSLRDHLSWSKVSEIFSVGYSMFEKLSSQLGDPGVDARWDLFQKLWESTVSIVARWILDNGGWVGQFDYIIFAVQANLFNANQWDLCNIYSEVRVRASRVAYVLNSEPGVL